MQFKYTGFRRDKSLAKGSIEASSLASAQKKLEQEGIEVLHLKKKWWTLSLNSSFGGRVKPNDRLFFVKHLGIMLKAGIPIAEALRMLHAQAKGGMKTVLKQVRNDVISGYSLSSALQKHPKVFSQLFVELIGSGEQAGTLESDLVYIAKFSKKELDMKKKVKSAMLYPSVVFFAVIGLVMSIGLLVLPQILPLFSSLKVDLPLSTQILLTVAGFFEAHGVKLLIALGILGASLPFLAELKVVQPLSHAIYLRTPIVGKLLREVHLGRFFRVFATLMEAGVPIDKALSITHKVVQNVSYKQGIERMSRSVTQGSSLSKAIQRDEFLFPQLVTHMMQVGEQSGNLGESFEYLADFYEGEVDEQLKNLSTLLEPLLLIFIGVLVGGVAFAIIGPIYSLSGSIG